MRSSKIESLIRNNFVWENIQSSFIVPYWHDLIESPESPIMLEIGCGSGRGTAAIAESFHPWRLDALDSDDESVKKATDYLMPDFESNVSVKKGKFSAIDAVDEKYDLIFDFFNLHHSRNWRKGVSEISRVLKPGGYFAFGQIWESSLRRFLEKNILTLESKKPFDRHEFIKELAEHRLRLLERNHSLWGYGLVGVAKKLE